VLPAAELYGDMLLDAGRSREASVQYDRALTRSRNRFNSLFGAGRAAEMTGDAEAATAFYQTLVDNCASSPSERPELEHAGGFLRSMSN